ncbi:MAG TPA: nuclear transport factor 2 family protein [Pyrinomonadaceae bacterium]|nr:nuclear transport factor 2 family protein [Pyrinomonadaceae bacterium]
MKSLLAFAILGAVMYVCGIGDTAKQTETPSNQAPVKQKADKESVKAELVKIEEDVTQAALNGDITLLVKNTTDDFKLTGLDGKVQDKNEALADVKKEKRIKSWSITDAELLSFSDDSAVLAYTQNVTLKTGQSGRARVTDSFVKKDGRWLIKSEQQTMIKK